MATKKRTAKKAPATRRKRRMSPRRGASSFLTRSNPSSPAKTMETLLVGAAGYIAVNIAVNMLLKTQTPAIKNGAKIALALALPQMVKHGKFAEAARLGSFALATKSIVDYARETLFKGSTFAESLAGDELTADEIQLLNNLALNGEAVQLNGAYDSYALGDEMDDYGSMGESVQMAGDYADYPGSLFGEDDDI